MRTEPVQAPPTGFRKSIPVTVKLDAVIRSSGRCAACGERLGELADVDFDHRPPIQLRAWDPEANDTVPACNDPAFIVPLHKDCHKLRTTGRAGESDLSVHGGDQATIAKVRRLAKGHQDFQRRLMSRGEGDRATSARPKRKIPSRPFPKRVKA